MLHFIVMTIFDIFAYISSEIVSIYVDGNFIRHPVYCKVHKKWNTKFQCFITSTYIDQSFIGTFSRYVSINWSVHLKCMAHSLHCFVNVGIQKLTIIFHQLRATCSGCGANFDHHFIANNILVSLYNNFENLSIFDCYKNLVYFYRPLHNKT